MSDLGAKTPLTLRGVQGYYTLPFAVRADEVVAGARLRLRYTWSPSLMEGLSQLNVRINDEIVASLPLPKAQAGTLVDAELPIAPYLVSDFSRIGLELIGHYAQGCEDPMHSSLWATVSNTSSLELDLAHVPQANDLQLLPQPFFDRREATRLVLPVVFAETPDLAALAAAGIVSSWFGAQASYRGASFPSRLGALPGTGNALVMSIGDAGLAALGLTSAEPLRGPALSVVAHPTDPTAKLLLVQGRDAAELKTAASALAVGGPTLSGPSVTVSKMAALHPRKPYDAPRWLSDDRAVRFGELAPPETFSVAGASPDLIRVDFTLPPDLFGWRTKGIPIDLKYRYSPRPGTDRSTLNININQQFVQAMPLGEDGASKWLQRAAELLPEAVAVKLPVSEIKTERERFYIPTFRLPARNQLQMHYFYDRPGQNTCKDTPQENVRGGIDADSTVDISSFSHFLAMPDLAAFGNSGFPFTRLADLSETAVILPDTMGAQEIDAYLTLMGRMGAATGYPALAVTLAHASAVDTLADKDLLLIGSSYNQPLFNRWKERLPAALLEKSTRLSVSDVVHNLVTGAPDLRPDTRRAANLVSFEGAVTDAVIAGFESPLRNGRSVVMVASGRDGGLQRAMEALLSDEKLEKVQGSAVLVRGDLVQALVGEQSYHVGQLAPLTALRWYFSRHPLLLALAALASVGVLAVLLFVTLRTRARLRLRHD